jgi:AcrR family transcriptional regulator
MDQTTGLRERKKAETRAALSHAALRLAVDHGADAVTAEAIARSANVSLRTFHNYFTTKDEAFLAPFRVLLEHAAEELRARPTDEPILVAIEEVWRHLATGAPAIPEDTLSQVAELWTSPALATYQHRLVAEAVRVFAEPIADRTGTDPVRDVYPTLVAAASVVAIFTAMEHGPQVVDPAHKAALVHESFDILRSGFQPPATGRLNPRHHQGVHAWPRSLPAWVARRTSADESCSPSGSCSSS